MTSEANTVLAFTVEETTQAMVERDSRRAKSLGCIVVNLATCKPGATRVMQPLAPWRNSDFVLAEKAMKGKELSHGTRSVISRQDTT